MSIEFSTSYKDENQEAADAVELLLDAALPGLLPFLTRDDPQFRVTGLTNRPANQGGWIAILKVTVEKRDLPGAVMGLPAPGDYVAYGYGTSFLGAMADLEAKFAGGFVKLAVDKYSRDGGNAGEAITSRSRARNRPKAT